MLRDYSLVHIMTYSHCTLGIRGYSFSFTFLLLYFVFGKLMIQTMSIQRVLFSFSPLLAFPSFPSFLGSHGEESISMYIITIHFIYC